MLQKQPVSINFSQGVDTKTDPFQVRVGKFLRLVNSIFTKGGRLGKRNGYQALTALSDALSSYATTFSGGLIAIGSRLRAYSSGSMKWSDRGYIQPVQLSVLPLIRNTLNQTQVDTAYSPNGLVCTVYTEVNAGTNSYKYAIADSTTGQNVVAPTALTTPSTTLGTPRVFLLGNYFVILYGTTTAANLAYFAISTVNPTSTVGPANVTTSYTGSALVAFDAAVLNNTLYIAWNGAASSGIKMASLTSTLTLSAVVTRDGSHTANSVAVCADATTGNIWVAYYKTAGTAGYVLAVDQNLNSVLAATQIISSGTVLNITASAQGGQVTVFYELSNNYSYDSAIPSHFVQSITCTEAGSVGSAATVLRSVGLASKSFIIDQVIYFLAAYQSPYQSTYFLVNGSSSTQAAPAVIAKLAYGNGGGYLATGLPNATASGSVAQIPYLFRDSIEAVNKRTNLPAGAQTAGIYSQYGLNLASFTIGGGIISAEIGNNLNLTGGITWAYDGYTPTEQNFLVWPDSVENSSTATTGGNLSAQIYYYQVTYEWTDNQGNAFRSAPSIPIKVDLSGSGTATNTATIQGPNLRLTYKTANSVKIVIYRWSQAQQTYYQVTSLTSPKLNSTTADSWSVTDTSSDATILGNNILYTSGGVVEDVAPPALSSVFLFDDRLFGIVAEDRNLLWFSKQVIEGTPVEMSDLLTFYVAPSTGAQGPSGDLVCGFPMDDKAILFKRAAIAYFNGSGPDNTGANSQYSQPILITSTLGCSNQNSIVFTPNGLMFEFQSESGNQIWLLGRDLSTRYIGDEVEEFTQSATVQSAVNIPGTNQVRFTMSSGITIMYDYYFGQWGTFQNVPAISSTLYQGLHTFINSFGQVYQENPGSYLDGSSPVLMSVLTGWINVAGLRGYERVYEYSFLGTYLSPHKLIVQTGYDYGSLEHQSVYSPSNFAPVFGADSIYGGGNPYGGPSAIEQFRVQTKRQKCKAFQISVQEQYDPSLGVVAGAGLTLSGVTMVVGVKKGWAPTPASKSIG